jgi:glycosyltransferase involved in cell wall biosynthesis
MVVNEAMSAGRAIIVSDHVGSGADLVHNGVNGYVYPCGDVAALTAALAAVLHSKEQAERMGQASAEIIKNWSFRQNLEGLRAAIAHLGKN